MKQYIRPQYLKEGDTIGVVAMASSLVESSRNTLYWKELYESWGLKVKLGKHLYDALPGEFAGTDEDRAADIEMMLRDPEVKAITSFRGGYGSMRTLRALDLSLFEKYPKWIIGFSDITIFHAMLQSKGMESILGCMPSTMCAESKMSEKFLHDALFGKKRSYSSKPHPYSKPGTATGRLVGGNLALMMSTLRTPWENHLDEDSILFIEDIDERMYTIDRMLLTLQQAGHLDRAKAVIIGQFTDIGGQDDWQMKVLDLIKQYTDPLDKPVLFGFPCGHEHPNCSLYLGREATLTVDDNGGKLIFK